MSFFKELCVNSNFKSYRGRAKAWHLLSVVGAKSGRTRRKQAKRLRMTEDVTVDPGAFTDWEEEGLWGVAT